MMTTEELERLNRRLIRLGLRPLKMPSERLLRMEAAERAVAADGTVIRRRLGYVERVR